LYVAVVEDAAAAMDDGPMGFDFLDDLDELKKAWNAGGVQECRSMLERKRDDWKTVALNVAVIGNHALF